MTVGDGAALTLNGYNASAASVTGTLSLGAGLTLNGEVMNAIYSLKAGESLVLLTLGNESAKSADVVLAGMELLVDTSFVADASKYFNTFDMGQYYLTFTDYSFSITAGAIPEPATASLSLLALAALAMRRRRK